MSDPVCALPPDDEALFMAVSHRGFSRGLVTAVCRELVELNGLEWLGVGEPPPPGCEKFKGGKSE